MRALYFLTLVIVLVPIMFLVVTHLPMVAGYHQGYNLLSDTHCIAWLHQYVYCR